jgi:hypothetical protein
MKKILLTVVIASGLVIGFSACNKVREALFPAIDVNLPAFQFSVPAIPVILNDEATLGSFTVPFNLDSIVRGNTGGTFGAGAVATVKVKQMVISVLNGDQNNNLANFESARFTLASNTKTNAAELISINFPDVYTITTTATPGNSPELKEYLAGTQLTYVLYGKARRTTSKPLTFNIAITLSAK